MYSQHRHPLPQTLLIGIGVLSAGFLAGTSAEAQESRKKKGERVEEAADRVAAETAPASSASQIPALARLLEQAGWTPTPELSGVFRPGIVFEVSTVGHRMLTDTCVTATPREATYTSSEMVTSLQAGVTVGGVMASANLSGGIVKKVKFGTPVQVTIPKLDLELTESCKKKLMGQPSSTLSSAYVVQEVLRAEIAEQTCGRIDASGRMVGLGDADSEFAAACQQTSLEPVAVGYRTVPLTELLGIPTVVTPPPAPVTSGGKSPAPIVDAATVVADLNAANARKAQLESQLTSCLAQEAKTLQSGASAEWARGGLADLEKMTDAAAKAKGKAPMEAFIRKYGAVSVKCRNELGERTESALIVEVDRARAWLAAPPTGGPVTAGEKWTGKVGYEMVAVMAGTYELGCTPGQSSCTNLETRHSVKLSRGFYIGRTEVTQAMWQTIVGTNPSHFSSCGATCPVEQVSWVESARFANALSMKEGLKPCYEISGDSVDWTTGIECTGYRLPTEAEWEVAARAGKDSLYAGGAAIDSVAWFDGNSGGTPHPVAQKAPNAYGLYDMSGNVWEWVWDTFGFYPKSSKDPLGATEGFDRTFRGGACYANPASARVSSRDRGGPGSRGYYLGLRLARTIP